MKSLFLVAFVAFLALVAASSAQELEISTALEGVWALELTKTDASAKFGASADIVHLVANFSRRDGELVGAISSADGSVSALIQLTPDGPRAGSFYLLGGSSSDDEFVAGAALMSFDLFNNTGRTSVASGEWMGVSGASEGALLSEPGFYQVAVTDNSIFVLNIITKKGQELVTITGSKTAVAADQPWYAQIGMPLLFVGAMSISRIMRSWFGGEKKPEGAPAAAVAGGTKAKKE